MKKVFFVPDTRSNRRKAARSLQAKRPHQPIVILLSMPVAIHSIIGVLDMPEGNADRGVRAKEITDACEGSTYVTVPPATIEAVRTNITAYNNATPATRPNLWRVMNNDMKALLFMFQQVADDDPENAVPILESGGFKIKQMAIPQKHEFEVKQSSVSGVVDLSAEGGPQRSCHDWRYSPDGVNFTRMIPTVDAHTQKTGLPVGRPAYFSHELITKDGPQGVSQVIKIDVK